MKEKRKGEIAYAALKIILGERKINSFLEVFKDKNEEEWKKMAKDIGISIQELQKFALILYDEITKETYTQMVALKKSEKPEEKKP